MTIDLNNIPDDMEIEDILDAIFAGKTNAISFSAGTPVAEIVGTLLGAGDTN
jgi:hypothetical protein